MKIYFFRICFNIMIFYDFCVIFFIIGYFWEINIKKIFKYVFILIFILWVCVVGRRKREEYVIIDCDRIFIIMLGKFYDFYF